MKSDWVKAKLGDVCMIERGGSPRPITDYLTDSPDGINWIKIGDAVEGSKYITSTSEKIKPEGMKKSRFVKKGDFILSNSMSFGKPYILGIDGCIHDGWLVIRDKENVFDKSFLYYYLGSERMYRQFEKLAAGGVVKNLNSHLVRNVDVVIPPIEEQQRIVDELDLLTDIIDKKNAQLRDLDTLAQSIFYEMFGNPVTNDKGWPKKRIGELVHLYNGRAFKPTDWTESGLPIVRIQNLNSPDSPYNCYDGVVDEAYLLKGGELLYAWSGTPGTSFGAHIWKGEKAVLNQHIFKVLFDEKYLNKLYFLYQLNLSVSSLFDQTHGGVGLKHITKGTLENQLVPLPNMELQNSFAQKVLEIDSEKDRLKCSLLQTKALLESRMSAYFNTK